jgi:hypothetical protein
MDKTFTLGTFSFPVFFLQPTVHFLLSNKKEKTKSNGHVRKQKYERIKKKASGLME